MFQIKLSRKVINSLFICFIISIYLYFIYITINRISYRVAYEEFLWDYKYGFSRRSFEGFLFSLIHKGKFSELYFIYLANITVVISILLFLVIAYFLIYKSYNNIFIILNIISSPLIFKNQIHDIGRQDQFGFILMEIIFIFCLFNKTNLAAIFYSILFIPLTLIADNNTLFWGPCCLLLILITYTYNNNLNLKVKRLNISFNKYIIISLVVFVISLFIPFFLSEPSISETEYRDYLQTKSYESIIFPGNTGYSTAALYLNPTKSNTIKNMHDYVYKDNLFELSLHNIYDYLFYSLPVILFLYYFYKKCEFVNHNLLNFICTFAFMVIFYIPAFYLGNDFPRYYANFISCIYFYLLCLCNYQNTTNFNKSITTFLIIIITLQSLIQYPFGIQTQDVNLITKVIHYIIQGFKGSYFYIVR